MRLLSAALASLAFSPANATVAAAQDAAAVDDEIVVTAALNRIRLTLGRDSRGKVVCRLDQSSGNPKIDKAVCKEAAKCVPKQRVSQETMNACLDERKKALVKKWTRGKGRAI